MVDGIKLIVPQDVKPLFASEAILITEVREDKETKKRLAFLRIRFVDKVSGVVIADVVLDQYHAKGLLKALEGQLTRMKSILESKEPLGKLLQKPVETKTDTGYIG